MEAASSIAAIMPSYRLKVLQYVASQPEGATLDEVEQALDMRTPTVSARMTELKRLGLIEATGKKRKTRSGRPAAVWAAKKSQRSIW